MSYLFRNSIEEYMDQKHLINWIFIKLHQKVKFVPLLVDYIRFIEIVLYNTEKFIKIVLWRDLEPEKKQINVI